jgi:putative FmdB family regulatory protein
MPTYEYRCEKGHTFDRIQKMSEKPLTKCPVCGAKAARVISGGQGVIFKGSGFYITDYGKDGKGARKDPDGSAKTESKSEATSDSKSSESTPKAAPASEAKPATAPKPGKPDAS